MRIICEKEILMNAIKVVENAVSLKNTLPILSNILIKVKDDKVFLIATDLELTIKHFFTTKIEEEGSITISAKKMSNIVRELPGKEVTLYTEKGNLIIICEKLIYKIKGLSEEEFPTFPIFKEDKIFNIKFETLIDMIKKTIYAVSNDEIRYVLNGLFLGIEKNQIKIVATDGHRLAYVFNQLETDYNGEIKIIIPKKVLHELTRISEIIKNNEIKVEIKISENQILFSLDSITIISRLIEGQFPEYKKVIPQNLNFKARINTHKVLDATRRISLISNIKSALIRYHFNNQNQLEIIAVNPEEGEGKEIIEMEEYRGEDINIGYNYRFIIEVFKNIETDEVLFEFEKPLTPGIIKPAGKDNFINVIMPMKLEIN